jgi:hypothetical protein
MKKSLLMSLAATVPLGMVSIANPSTPIKYSVSAEASAEPYLSSTSVAAADPASDRGDARTCGTIPAVPGPAQALGFTTLAVNFDARCYRTGSSSALTDFNGTGMSLERNTTCDGHAAPPQKPGALWWQGYWYAWIYGTPCSWIHVINDPNAGQNVLDLEWHPISTSNGGAIPEKGDALETITRDGHTGSVTTRAGYYEAIYAIINPQQAPLWTNALLWAQQAVPSGNKYGGNVEFDMNETHAEIDQLNYGGTRSWNYAGSPGWMAGTTNTWTPSVAAQYHKYAMSIVPSPNAHPLSYTICSYIDDVNKGCGSAPVNSLDQNSFGIFTIAEGCNYNLDDLSCINRRITAVRTCKGLPGAYSQRDACLTVDQQMHLNGEYQNLHVTVTGQTGCPEMNGRRLLWGTPDTQPNPVTQFELVNFPYSPNCNVSGTVNALTRADIYVKSWRVWAPGYATVQTSGSFRRATGTIR